MELLPAVGPNWIRFPRNGSLHASTHYTKDAIEAVFLQAVAPPLVTCIYHSLNIFFKTFYCRHSESMEGICMSMFYDALTNNFERAEGYKTLQLSPPPLPSQACFGRICQYVVWYFALFVGDFMNSFYFRGGGSIMLPAPCKLSSLRFWLACNARAYTSARNIGFCVIWVWISSSSSFVGDIWNEGVVQYPIQSNPILSKS